MSKSGPKTTDVVLAGPVRHRGVPKAKGDTISVTAPQKAWLEKRELIAPSKSAGAAASTSSKES